MPELLKLEVPQFELLDSDKFVDFLRARDIRVSEEQLEHFEKIGFLYPVLRLRRPVTKEDNETRYCGIMSSSWYLKKYLEAGLLEFPNQENFRPWSNYVDKDGEENTFIYYHPYQVFLLDRFLNLTTVTLTSSYIENATNAEKMLEQAKEMYRHVKNAFLNARPKLVEQIGLLLQLQNAYQPSYRGIVHLTWDQNSLEQWENWRVNVFSPPAVLKDIGISPKEVTELRDYFAAQGHFVDPMTSWYSLVRLISFYKKERLKGKALLAQDYYEIVGILNFFLKDLTGEEQPEPDDIVDGRRGRWKDSYYGMKFDYRNEKIRRKIVSDYLYVTIPKVVLLVEGESEETAINVLMGGFGRVPEQDGIAIHNFEGTGGISSYNASAVLRIAKKQEVGRYLIIDNDEGAKELVEELVERLNLLDSNCYRMWDTDFEGDNFTLDEITEIVNAKLSSIGLQPILAKEVEDRRTINPKEKVWKTIQTICWMKNQTELDNIITKKTLARILCEKRVDQIQSEIKESKYKPKWKIEEEIIKIHETFCE
jgi:hypothetical protein